MNIQSSNNYNKSCDGSFHRRIYYIKLSFLVGKTERLPHLGCEILLDWCL